METPSLETSPMETAGPQAVERKRGCANGTRACRLQLAGGYDQSPGNAALRQGMLVMTLGWERVAAE